MEQQPQWRQRLDTLSCHAYEVGLLVNDILQLPAADRELAVDHNADVAVLVLKARLHGTGELALKGSHRIFIAGYGRILNNDKACPMPCCVGGRLRLNAEGRHLGQSGWPAMAAGRKHTRLLMASHCVSLCKLFLIYPCCAAVPNSSRRNVRASRTPCTARSHQSLPGWYTCIEDAHRNRSPLLRMTDGTPFKLPVHSALYHRQRFNSVAQELVEPDYLSQACVLSSAVSVALYHSKNGVLGDAIPVKLEDEMSLACK